MRSPQRDDIPPETRTLQVPEYQAPEDGSCLSWRDNGLPDVGRMRKFLNSSDIAHSLSVNQDTARRLIRANMVHVKIGGELRVEDKEFDRYLDSITVQPVYGRGRHVQV